ncbi:MAG: hypothetical protein ACREGB_00290 [Candidatus Saccharimonadales bacterium]
MIGSPEVPTFDAQAFDESFFAAYEEQLSGISVEEQASRALKEILTIKKADGTQKSYEEIRDQTQAFFANDLVRNDEVIMNRMAMEFARSCMGHNHGAELAQDTQLGSVFEAGVNNLIGDKHDGHSHKGKDDEYETDPKTGKKKKKKRSWFGVYH